MKRGDVVTAAVSGAYGKPRPAIVVQSDQLGEIDSVLLCLVTSDLVEAAFHRLDVAPDAANGLRKPSQIMLDKIMAAPRAKVGAVIGRLDASTMEALDIGLLGVLGISQSVI